MIDRRSLLGGALLMPTLGRVGAAGAVATRQEFEVFRNGAAIGHHRLDFTPDGDRLSVAIEIELRVKLAFVTVYRYRHTNREEWQAGRLVSFASRTDDDGTPHRVRAERAGEVIVVESDQGRVEAPGDAMPTTYWDRRFLAAPAWIDTQAGRLLSCRVEPRGRAEVTAAGTTVPADRLAVIGDLTLDLWYDGPRWVKLEFPGPDGSLIEYRLIGAAPPPVAAAG